MKKRELVGILTAGWLALGAGPAFAAEKICPDPGCSDPVSKAIQEIAKKELEDFGKKLDGMKTDYSTLDSCLGDLMKVPSVGGTFPSFNIQDIIGKLCSMARDELNKRMGDLNLEYGVNLNDLINVKDLSPDIFSELEKILHGGK